MSASGPLADVHQMATRTRDVRQFVLKVWREHIRALKGLPRPRT
jgi:hypothetical protein